MLEIYFNTVNERIQLPVTPSTIGVNRDVGINKQNVIKVGEVSHFTGEKLKTLSLSSFFPFRDTHYTFKTSLRSYDLVNKFVRWQSTGQQLRLVIPKTGVNMVVLIEKFNTSEKDGTGDIYYNMDLVEYKSPTADNIDPSTDNYTRPNDNEILKTEEDKLKQETHKVVKGDTLYGLSKKYLDHTDWKVLANYNVEKYPTLARSTIIQIGWELLIPND